MKQITALVAASLFLICTVTYACCSWTKGQQFSGGVCEGPAQSYNDGCASQYGGTNDTLAEHTPSGSTVCTPLGHYPEGYKAKYPGQECSGINPCQPNGQYDTNQPAVIRYSGDNNCGVD